MEPTTKAVSLGASKVTRALVKVTETHARAAGATVMTNLPMRDQRIGHDGPSLGMTGGTTKLCR